MNIVTITSKPTTSWLLDAHDRSEISADHNPKLTQPNDTSLTPKSLLVASAKRDLLKPTPSTYTDNAKLSRLIESGQMGEFQKKLNEIKAKNDITGFMISQKKDLLTALAASLPTHDSVIEANSGDVSPTVLTQNDLGFLDAARITGGFTRSGQNFSTEFSANSSATTALLRTFSDVAAKSKSSISSSKVICENLSKAIESMGKNYLDIFQIAVEKLAKFYADFSQAIGSLKEYFSADGDKIVLNKEGFDGKLIEVYKKYVGKAGVLYSASSNDEAKAWAKEMGLDPDKYVSENVVRIDLSVLQDFRSSMQKGPEKFNTAQWAAYQSSVDILKDSVQTSMQSLTQKYSNANSTFDNLVKVLSSTISQLLDSDKSFLNI